MIKIQKKLDGIVVPEAFSRLFNAKDSILFDIETTGLSHKYTKVILIGFIYFHEDDVIFEQIFCEDLDEEILLLKEVEALFSQDKVLISFNGDAFDISYLNSRFAENGMDFQIDKHFSLDLLKVTRKNKDHLQLDNYKLKTVERFLGIEREDLISGKESVEMYFQYLESRDEDLKKQILLHNYEDILNLIHVSKICDFAEDHTLVDLGPVIIRDNLLRLSKLAVHKSYATIRFVVLSSSQFAGMDYIHEYFSYSRLEGCLTFRLPIFSVENAGAKYTFLDVDSIEGFNQKFNNLNLDEKMKLLLMKDRVKYSYNAMNIIEKILERSAL